jgi:hypothetical protein
MHTGKLGACLDRCFKNSFGSGGAGGLLTCRGWGMGHMVDWEKKWLFCLWKLNDFSVFVLKKFVFIVSLPNIFLFKRKFKNCFSAFHPNNSSQKQSFENASKHTLISLTSNEVRRCSPSWDANDLNLLTLCGLVT